MKQKGQSLVEMALITPLLIIMLVGVFEVGWALRGYLILSNASREASRFAVRPLYLDFTSSDPGWYKVKEQALSSIAQTLPVDFQTKGTLKASFIQVSSGNVLTYTTDITQYEKLAEFNDKFIGECVSVSYTATVLTPSTNPTYTATFGEFRESHFDYNKMGQDLVLGNRKDNCNLATKNGLSKNDGLIIVEIWYDQPQLFGLLSNKFVDPIPLYTYSIFRYTNILRGSGQENDPFK